MCPEVLPTSCGRASGFILRSRRSSRPRGCWQYLLACSEYQLVRPLTAQYCSLTAARVPFVALSFFIRALRLVIENVLLRCKSLQLSSREADCGKFWALSTEFPTGLLNSCRVLCLAQWDHERGGTLRQAQNWGGPNCSDFRPFGLRVSSFRPPGLRVYPCGCRIPRRLIETGLSSATRP
jgi:hypothetical protein